MRRKWLVPLLLLALLTLCFLWGVTGYPHPAQLPSGGSLEAPSAAHWLGTDNLGVDIYAQISAGFFRSLGIGLAAAQGMALGLKLNHSDARVYAVLGDGELDEGAVWEAAASAVKFGLDNLTAIVDWNKVQLDGTTDEIMPLRDLPGKWKAFGWNVLRCDGHDLAALDAALDAAVACKGVPTVILADTIKGKGVSFMEGKSAWHGKAIPDAEFAQAMQELGGNV